ncbi:MAG: hypothetical protein AB8B65_19275 [Kordia sp.]|uniref:hypothetical protein n=1 Tax=Kordia sp. TaxID=1965332 RepID=UPI0038585CA0
MENKVDASNLNESSIYEGGSLSQINASDLKDNEIAIKQLINNHLLVIAQSQQKDIEIQDYKSTIEYLKTSPFTAIIATIINFCGSIMIGFSVNLYTQDPSPKYSWIILTAGALLVLTGSLSNILYPFARKWFNKDAR